MLPIFLVGIRTISLSCYGGPFHSKNLIVPNFRNLNTFFKIVSKEDGNEHSSLE